MSELVCLQLAIVLWFVHLFCQMGTAQTAFSRDYLFSSRDIAAEPANLTWGRASRAFRNYVENLVAFIALDLGLIITHHSAWFAPTVWIIARFVYLPLYLFDIIYARTVAAGIAMMSMLVMLWALVGL